MNQERCDLPGLLGNISYDNILILQPFPSWMPFGIHEMLQRQLVIISYFLSYFFVPLSIKIFLI